jgi:HK97 family phage prohead protease
MTAGFQLNSFRLNPVFLWAHDCSQPPIGRISSIAVQSNRLLGTIEYADPDLSQFADMIFRMVKRGFLNAVSISWKPIEWKYAKEKDRNGGIDFVKQDLLEVSQVPVPALATALATARSAGIDVTPMKTWAERVLDERNSTLLQKLDPEHIRAIACGQQTDNYVNRERRIREAEAIALSCPD